MNEGRRGVAGGALRREPVDDFLPRAGDSERRTLMTLGLRRGEASPEPRPGLSGSGVFAAAVWRDRRLSGCETNVASLLVGSRAGLGECRRCMAAEGSWPHPATRRPVWAARVGGVSRPKRGGGRGRWMVVNDAKHSRRAFPPLPMSVLSEKNDSGSEARARSEYSAKPTTVSCMPWLLCPCSRP